MIVGGRWVPQEGARGRDYHRNSESVPDPEWFMQLDMQSDHATIPSLSALEVTKSPMVCHHTMHHLRPHRGGKAAWYLLFASSLGNYPVYSSQCGVMLPITHVQAVEVRTSMVKFCSSSFEVIGGLQERI